MEWAPTTEASVTTRRRGRGSRRRIRSRRRSALASITPVLIDCIGEVGGGNLAKHYEESFRASLRAMRAYMTLLSAEVRSLPSGKPRIMQSWV